MEIQSVHRALDILSLFSHGRHRLGITEMSRLLSLPKGTVHGLVSTLLQRGFLQQDPETRKYHLGLRIYELGTILAGTLEINQKASGPAHQLARRTRLVARVAIWDGDSALVTLNVHPRAQSVLFHQIGPRVPGYSSAIGKAILAFLDTQDLGRYLERTLLIPFTSTTITEPEHLLRELEETQRRGYAVDLEETVAGLACMGAPIFERGGGLTASISLSGNPERVLGGQRAELADLLIKSAAEISRDMGHFPEAVEAPISPMQIRTEQDHE